MRVLLVITDSPHYAGTGFAEAWTEALEDRGCDVERRSALPPHWARDGVPAEAFDLAIPHVLSEEVAVFAPTMRLAALLDAAGVPLLNGLGAIAATADKLATHAAWATAGLPQPLTVPLDGLERWPAGRRPMVLKPALGDGARDLALVAGLDEARAAVADWRAAERRDGRARGQALLQERIEDPVCTRLYATPWRTSAAYVKDRRPGALVTHGTVYPRIHTPPPAMAALARHMVAAVDGGLMGVDVLTDADGRHWALEANAPFGFDITDREQRRFVADAAIEVAGRVGGRRAAAV